jgi:hypothetical protein
LKVESEVNSYFTGNTEKMLLLITPEMGFSRGMSSYNTDETVLSHILAKAKVQILTRKVLP